MTMPSQFRGSYSAVMLGCILSLTSIAQAQKLQLTIVEAGGEKPVAARVHLGGPDGKPVKPAVYPSWYDHFVCNGTAELDLPAGSYKLVVERGPEYFSVAKTFDLKSGETLPLRLEMHRLANLAAEGWYGGELHVHRNPADVTLLMRAEDLYVANVITWWNEQNPWEKQPLPENPLVRTEDGRIFHVMGGEDERGGGALLFANLARPMNITGSAREHPSSLRFLYEAAQLGACVDIEKPFWWDTPLWLATGKVHTVGIANNHMNRSGMYPDEAWGKPRDTARLPAPHGNGFWTQEIYYHILNSGLRIPPSAGSASGVLPNPVGYNRVYVHVEGELTYEKWWRGLLEGRSFVTNGPLLRVKANGHWPGHVFTSQSEAVTLDLAAEISSVDAIKTIQIIRDGRVEREVPYSEWKATGSLGKLTFDRSGWFLVRAIADVQHTFRFASTAPFYVQIGDQSRVSASSVRFFLDWIGERRRSIEKAVADPGQRAEVMKPINEAERFWTDRYKRANAD